MKRFLLLLVLLGAVGVVASAASITMIDDFTLVQSPIKLQATGVSTAVTATSGSTTIGAFARKSSVTRVADDYYEETDLSVGGGRWTFDSGDFTSGYGSSVYTPVSGTTVDASCPSYKFAITLVSNRYDVPAGTLTFFLTDADSSWSTSISPLAIVNKSASSVTYTYVLTSTAANAAGLDFSKLASAGFTFSGGSSEGLDVTFSNFSLTGVPEPGTYALMGLGLAGLAFIRRRK
jgi:hypothetical protein